MERINTILDKMSANMPELKKTYRSICLICRSEVVCEDHYPHNRDRTVCSKECYEIYKRDCDREYYEKNVLHIPIKYRTIEADKELVSTNYGINLFITGKSGSGKTVLAAGIVKQGVNKRVDYKWINYPQFIMELQNMYRKDNESPFDKADEIANFNGLLVIDDMGAEKMTDWVRQITYFIINEREQRCLPVLITSNFTLEQIAEQIDVRISSRIAGMCKSVKLSGNDRRLEASDKTWQQGEAKKNESKYRRP